MHAVICTDALTVFSLLVITAENSEATSETTPVKTNSCEILHDNKPKGIFLWAEQSFESYHI